MSKTELKPKTKKRVPFVDWLLFVTNFTWAYALFRILANPPADINHLRGLQQMAWVGICGTVLAFGFKLYQKRKANNSPQD